MELRRERRMNQDSCTIAWSSFTPFCNVTACESLDNSSLDGSTDGDSECLVSLSLQSESVKDGEGARFSLNARELLESVRGGSEVKLSRLSAWSRESDLFVWAASFGGTSDDDGSVDRLPGFIVTREEVVDISRLPEDYQKQREKKLKP